MTDVDCLLLSRFYQIAKISVIKLETFLPKTTNPELQTFISNQILDYDAIVKECCTLSKSHCTALPENSFFKRCKQITEDFFVGITSIDKKTIISCISTLNLVTLAELYDVESASSETINIGKHLLAIHNNNLQTLTEK